MPLESSILCLDTSEWMRNGDYAPTRLEAQQDAVNLVCGCKLRDHPESTVGVLTTGGKGVKMLSSPTTDSGKLLAILHGLVPGGANHFTNGIKVAMLALRHRPNKHGAQRIVSFVGSPVLDDERSLKRLADTLRKNTIHIDVVSIGENGINEAKLQAFVDAVNKDGNQSHYVCVPQGMLPSDVLMTSPVIQGEGGAPVTHFSEFGGIDPTMDPELAAAMRASIEESRVTTTAGDRPAAPGQTPGPGGLAPAATGGDGMDLDEEAMLQAALELSMAGASFTPAAPTPAPVAPAAPTTGDLGGASAGGSSAGGDAAPAAASVPAATPAQPTVAATPGAPGPAAGGQFNDPQWVESLLSSLGDVDMSDPSIQAAMAAITGGAPAPDPAKKEGEGGDKK